MPDQPAASEKLPPALNADRQTPRSSLSAELREILEFNERENQKHRDYFQMLYKQTAGALTVIVVVLGALVAFAGLHTIDDIQKQAKAATSEEITNIRQQSHDTLDHQTTAIQQQITKRLDDEFKTETIRQTVQNAAKQQTAGALMPIITGEVRSQVSAGVKSEQATVQTAMLQEVHKSVEDLKPTINKRVDDTVSQSVNTAVASQVDSQIAPRLKQIENSTQIITLINQAQSGDGPSFDTLVVMAGDPQVPQTSRNLALKVAKSLVSHNAGFYTTRSFTEPKTEAQEAQLLLDSDQTTRQAAVDSLGLDYWKGHMDQLFGIMTADLDLGVRASAYNRFKSITQIKFVALDNYSAVQWWNLHRKEFVK